MDSERRAHVGCAAALGVMVALPLVVWPGREGSFSTPKLWLLACAVAGLGALSVRVPVPAPPAGWPSRVIRALPVAWLVPFAAASVFGEFVSFDALLLGVAGPCWALVLMRLSPDTRSVLVAQTFGGVAVSAVAILQWAGHDPFALAGWAPVIDGASERLRVYGTLGNPNYVAAWLAGSLPFTAALVRLPDSHSPGRAPRLCGAPLHRCGGMVALVLEAAALGATGSRAGALGMAAAGVVFARAAGGRRTAWLTAAVLAAAGLLVVVSPARPLGQTWAGRLHIWSTAWPHAVERPWTGQGPGAFEMLYPEWERAARRDPDGRLVRVPFAGPERHAHNDYLEALIERGVPGSATLTILLVIIPWVGFVSRDGSAAPSLRRAASAAGLAALAAVALVDFPLARPAETALAWTAVAMLGTSPRHGGGVGRE